MTSITTTKLGDKEYALVTVSKTATIQGVCDTDLMFTDKSKDDPYPLSLDDVDGIKLPEGQWELVGKGSELTEEQWKEIVGKEYFEDDTEYWYIYEPNGKIRANLFYDTATESGISWLTSLGATGDFLILKEQL